jgi:hypothetical protein
MTAAALFLASFGLVFLLGVQQLNVQGGHKAAAALTSVAIGLCNLVVLKVAPGPTNALEVVGFLAGGPVGIVAAMVAHPILSRRFGRG